MENVVRTAHQLISTGDQCGRDTPDANLTAMVETARTYGKY